MAAQFEGQKASARKELDRLHRGIIVDLDRRLIQPSALPEGGVQESEEPELSEAVRIVERTARTLQAFKEATVRQDKLLGENASRVKSLESELQSATADRLELSNRLELEVLRADELALEKEALEAKLESLEQECVELSAQLKGLTQLIKTSLSGVASVAQN